MQSRLKFLKISFVGGHFKEITDRARSISVPFIYAGPRFASRDSREWRSKDWPPSFFLILVRNRLVGLVVKASASRAEDSGFESRLRRDFFGVESYQ